MKERRWHGVRRRKRSYNKSWSEKDYKEKKLKYSSTSVRRVDNAGEERARRIIKKRKELKEMKRKV